MAFSTLTFHTNAIPGEVQLPKFNPRESATSPSVVVGTKVTLADGRVFRYAHFGSAATVAQLVAQEIADSGTVSATVIAPASAVAVVGEPSGQLPGDENSRFVQITLASAEVNQYAGGNLLVEDGTGEGHNYRIKGNTATNDPATGDIRLELYDRIVEALDGTSRVHIVGDRFANLKVALLATDVVLAGFSLVAQAIDDFGWVQTKGLTAVQSDGALVLGSNITASDSTAGSVQIKDAETEQQIGYAATISGGAGEFGLAVINLD